MSKKTKTILIASASMLGAVILLVVIEKAFKVDLKFMLWVIIGINSVYLGKKLAEQKSENQ
jgi:hypothetical protein